MGELGETGEGFGAGAEGGVCGRGGRGVVVGGVVVGEVGGAVDGGVGEGHELVQDGELEFQLDAVDHRLQRRFDLVVPIVLERQQHDVHGDDGQVDPDQLHHHAARAAVVDGPQKLDGRVDVDAGDDELLDAEGRHLEALHDVEGVDERGGVGRIGAVREDGGGDVEADGVHDDHDEDAAEDFVLAHHQMQARVQHDRLPGHHGVPSYRDDCHR